MAKTPPSAKLMGMTLHGGLPTWPKPGYYGRTGALDSMGGTAAPMLAGFTLTIATLVLTSPAALNWPGVTVFFATVGGLSFVASVQFMFWAKQNAATPDDMKTWGLPVDEPSWRRVLVDELERFQAVYEMWARRGRVAYDIGVIALLASLGSALVPTSHSEQPALRWVTVGLVALALIVEILWSFAKGAPTPARRPWGIRQATDWLTREPFGGAK